MSALENAIKACRELTSDDRHWVTITVSRNRVHVAIDPPASSAICVETASETGDAVEDLLTAIIEALVAHQHECEVRP